jgi:hypothetical protein
MIGDAQEAFARSGDKNVKDVLLDIVARRSKSTTQTREAITLNSAARIATNLTLDEFSNLALVYVLRYTMRTVRNFNDFCTYFEATVMPLAKTATKEESSIRHIEANACGKNSLITRAGWRDLIIGNYGGVLGTGFDLEAAEERVGEERREYLRSTLIPSFHDPAKFQPKAQVKPHYLETFKDSGLQATELTAVWDLYATTMPEDATQMIARLSAQIPDIKLLNDVWEGLAGLELTNVGFAIGHAYATRAVNFNAPLNIWIK